MFSNDFYDIFYLKLSITDADNNINYALKHFLTIKSQGGSGIVQRLKRLVYDLTSTVQVCQLSLRLVVPLTK